MWSRFLAHTTNKTETRGHFVAVGLLWGMQSLAFLLLQSGVMGAAE